MDMDVRLIKPDELEKLLSLYEHLNLDDPELEIDETLKEHWKEILADPNLFYLVVEKDGMLISSCNMAIIKNLTRSASPYGLVEQVVTHPHYRKKGYGTAVLKKAVEIAREKNCYKVMLLTSMKDEETLRFYERAGFDGKEKTGFIVRIKKI
jgi:GNAT superfamily N-acetyltransferase